VHQSAEEDLDMLMSVWFLTNQSRAALREAEFRETEAVQTLTLQWK